MTLPPIRLLPSYREKIWGATALEPWFRDSEKKIGEVWFTFDENQTDEGRPLAELMRAHGAALVGRWPDYSHFPILTKFIYTTDRLSIQVHPDDEHARAWEGTSGKTEMWHVLRAEPGAAIALGFTAPLSRERLREAALSGEIERLVRWFPARAGDTFFTPPGTVHAIGPGLALVEIQQNCDVTYRLYDYGRPRELHLEKAVAVADLRPHPGPSQAVEVSPGCLRLARCRYFSTELVSVGKGCEYRPDPASVQVLIVLEGRGAFAGRPFAPGETWLIPACTPPFPLTVSAPVRLLRTYVP